MLIDICLSPALYPFCAKENDTVIVVDIFRASTTMCMALANGASAIIPVAGVNEAKRYKAGGFLVGAERNARKMDFADFGNSPFDYTRESVSGKDIVFTTTNGTQAIDVARDASHLFVGAFSNISALMEKCLQIGERTVVLCAGWNNHVNIEDTLFGGAFVDKLMEERDVVFESDTVRMALDLWRLAKENPLDFVKSSDHYKRLVRNNAEGDAAFCFQQNTISVVPWYDKASKKLMVDK